MRTHIQNEIVIAGHTFLVSATILSTLDDRGDVVITEITGILVNGMLPGPRLARRVEDILADDAGVYEELCLSQPTADQMMLDLAETEYDAQRAS